MTAQDDAGSALAELLGGPPPASVAALPDAHLAELGDIVRAALAEQRAHLAAAFDATLKHVPFPLRGVVRRALVG